MLYHGGQLHHRHLKGSISTDCNYLTVRAADFCSHRCRQRVAHGAHTAGGKKTPFFYHMVTAGPDLILSHICNVDSILLHFFGKQSDEASWIYIAICLFKPWRHIFFI